MVMQAMGQVVYLPVVRDHVVQAQYFKAPFQLKRYLSVNPFLPDINNEHNQHVKNQYKQNLMHLDTLALVRFLDDITGVHIGTQLHAFCLGATRQAHVCCTSHVLDCMRFMPH